jgi:hypothetical protein
VDVIDTAVGKIIGTYNLAERTRGKNLIPEIQGTIDQCLTDEALFDASSGVFFTAVPETQELKPDGSRNFHLLGFSVPGLELVKVLPGGSGLNAEPHVVWNGKGTPQVVRDSDWTPVSQMELSDFAPDRKAIPNQILERSGQTVLFHLFTADANEVVLAVAEESSKTVTRLLNVPPTSPLNAHIAPGGGYVYLEETKNTEEESTKTGKSDLFDSRTGHLLQRFADPHIRAMALLAIAPLGKAVYHTGSVYWFLDLGSKWYHSFGTRQVTRPITNDYPGLFFADQAPTP